MGYGGLAGQRVWRLASSMTPLERRVNMAAVFLPFLVVAAGRPAAVGRWIGWSGRARLRLDVPPQRLRRDRRLPPDADPPRLPDAHRRRATCSPYLGSLSVQGPVIDWVADHRKHHAHTDQEGDPHSPARRPRRRRARRAARPLARARRLAVAHPRPGARAQVRQGPRRGPRHAHHQPQVPADRRSPALALPALLGVAADQDAAGRAHRPDLGRLRAHLPPAPRHLVGQLGLPLLRQAPLRRSRTSRPTSSGSRSRPSASPGTTTTTRSRARPRTACAGRRSTRRRC